MCCSHGTSVVSSRPPAEDFVATTHLDIEGHGRWLTLATMGDNLGADNFIRLLNNTQ